MANISLLGASYQNVPAVDLPKTGGGTARFHEVSGSQTVNANGTYDVTALAQLVVAVPIQHYYTGSSAPSASLGVNGDIYLQTES